MKVKKVKPLGYILFTLLMCSFSYILGSETGHGEGFEAGNAMALKKQAIHQEKVHRYRLVVLCCQGVFAKIGFVDAFGDLSMLLQLREDEVDWSQAAKMSMNRMNQLPKGKVIDPFDRETINALFMEAEQYSTQYP